MDTVFPYIIGGILAACAVYLFAAVVMPNLRIEWKGGKKLSTGSTFALGLLLVLAAIGVGPWRKEMDRPMLNYAAGILILVLFILQFVEKRR